MIKKIIIKTKLTLYREYLTENGWRERVYTRKIFDKENNFNKFIVWIVDKYKY